MPFTFDHYETLAGLADHGTQSAPSPQASADRTTIDTEDLRRVFDMVVNSMGFGSGFLETEDVETLRAIAATLGVDPMTATPSEFRGQYAHAFEPIPAITGTPRAYWQPENLRREDERRASHCEHCGREKGERPHE